MQNKNSKSRNNIVREAENIIEKYLNDREMSDIKRYYDLKEKYERLKILTISIFIVSGISMLFNIILK